LKSVLSNPETAEFAEQPQCLNFRLILSQSSQEGSDIGYLSGKTGTQS
jgi:hypothetical protein